MVDPRSFLDTPKSLIWPFIIMALFCFALFVAVLAVASPLCCADDASIAVVSKNLAYGLAYLSTVNYWGSGAD